MEDFGSLFIAALATGAFFGLTALVAGAPRAVRAALHRQRPWVP